MRRIAMIVLAAVLTFCGIGPRAQADPIIQLKQAAAFQAAINAGLIAGVNPAATDPITQANLAALARAYPTQSNLIRNTGVSTNRTPINGLVSATGSAKDLNKQLIGAWSYHGPDPDWIGSAIEFEPFLPEVGAPGTAGIDSFTLSIIDTQDRVKLWQWSSAVLKPGFQDFLLNFSAGAGAGGSTSFFEDSGFDLAHASILQFGYRGTLTNFPPTPPTVDPLEPISLWTGMGLVDVPEPGAVTLLALGLMGAAAYWRKRPGNRRSRRVGAK